MVLHIIINIFLSALRVINLLDIITALFEVYHKVFVARDAAHKLLKISENSLSLSVT